MNQFTPGITAGIALHRAIDEFTDRHPAVRQSKKRLQPAYRHYAGVIVDMFYDHLLAANWSRFSDQPLAEYTTRVYKTLSSYESLFPLRMQQLFPHIVAGNWLFHYQFIEGIGTALSGMARRSTFDSGMEKAVEDLRTHYSSFQDEFDLFYPQLQHFCQAWIEEHPA